MKLRLINVLKLIISQYIAAVEKMMKIGILECASLRRQTTLSENVTFCSYKKKSFSDMQHLIQCRCNSIRT